MKKIILLLSIFILSCNEPRVRQSDEYRYEITVTFGVIGYPYDCDAYIKQGSTYKLFRGKRLFKTIDVGSSVVVSVIDRTQ